MFQEQQTRSSLLLKEFAPICPVHLNIIQIEPKAWDEDWKGGFFCPCHGSKFDLAGRVYKNVPAPTNLEVPPHSFQGDTLIIGEA